MSVQRLARITAAALGALALTAPAATAKPYIGHNGSGDDASVAVAPERITNEPAAPQPSRVVVAPERVTNEVPSSVPRVPGPTVVVEADDRSFDWGSAGIGAGTIVGLALLAAGGMMLLGRHGTHLRPSH